MKIKDIIYEGSSSEEQRMAKQAIKRFADYRQSGFEEARQDLLRALAELGELEEGSDFNLTNKQVDPETGAVSHTVVYTPMVTLQREVEELYEAFKRTLKQYPEDSKLEKFFDVYASFKRQFKTHVNRKYNK